MRIDFEAVRAMEFAARRQRAVAMGALIAAAFAWIVARKPGLRHAARPHFAR